MDDLSRRPSLDGLSKITDERIYQIQKGWTLKHDRRTHNDRSLASAAVSLLSPHAKTPDYEKRQWVEEMQEKHGGDYEACLRIAGALIAAELTRISE